MCLAIPGKIISINEEQDEALYADGNSVTGKVLMGGIKKDVNLELLPEAALGDYVLVHVGVAISIVDEAEAEETLQFLDKMGDLDELEPEKKLRRDLAAEKKHKPAEMA
jgi:hydrogenase expression/formation protein HypC